MDKPKRERNYCLNRDDKSGSDDDAPKSKEDFTAAKDVIATRRIVRVARHRAPEADSSSATGMFKGVAAAPSPSGPALTSSWFKAPAFGTVFPSTLATAPSQGPCTDATAIAAPEAVSAPATKVAAPATVTTTAAAAEKTPLFGAGLSTEPRFGQSFNFSDAVNLFTAAKKRMDEAQEGGSAESDVGSGGATETVAPTGSVEEPRECATVHSSDEVVVAEVDSKLSSFAPSEKKWVGQGAGTAKILRHEVVGKGEGAPAKRTVHRLIVREGYSLNVSLDRKCFRLTKSDEKSVLFAVVGTDGGSTTYALQFTVPTDSEKGRLFCEALAKVLEGETSSATS